MSSEAAVEAQERAGGGDEAAMVRRLAGKYMTFQLAAETYGLEIVTVREIIRLMEITHVPGTREFMRGVVSLRGKVIPVVDLRLKLGMPRAEATEQTVIIVVQFEVAGRSLTAGVLVDQVLEVRSVEASKIEPPPSFGAGVPAADFIRGIGMAEDRVIFLLDLGRVLSESEANELARAGEPTE